MMIVTLAARAAKQMPAQAASGVPQKVRATSATQGADEVDAAMQALVAMIPAETVTLFTAVVGIAEAIATAGDRNPTILLTVVYYVIAALSIGVYLIKSKTDANNDNHAFKITAYVVWHCVAIFVAFTLWAFAISESTFKAVTRFATTPGSPDLTHDYVLIAVLCAAVALPLLERYFQSAINRRKASSGNVQQHQ